MAKNKPQIPEDVASKRLRIISPLLDETLDSAKIIELKKKIMQPIASMALPESNRNRVISARIIPCQPISRTS